MLKFMLLHAVPDATAIAAPAAAYARVRALPIDSKHISFCPHLTALHRISPMVHIVLRSRCTFYYALRCTTLCTNHPRARPRSVRAVSASRCMLAFANVRCQMPHCCVASRPSPASTPRHIRRYATDVVFNCAARHCVHIRSVIVFCDDLSSRL